MNMDIWIVGTLNQVFLRRSYTEIEFSKAVFYGSFMFSIVIVSTKTWYASFLLKKVFVPEKTCFKFKILKTFKTSSEIHIK